MAEKNLMHDETWFRIALVVVILITMAIGIPHRLKAAASDERISHKEEGYLFAATLRIAGLLLWLSTIAYLLFPASSRSRCFTNEIMLQQ